MAEAPLNKNKNRHIPPAKRVVAIVNPNSGMGNGERVIQLLEQQQKQAEISIFRTSPHDLAQHYAALKHAQTINADRLIVVGGDGTLFETLCTMFEHDIVLPIFMIPAGTGNIIANDLDMPRRLKYAVQHAFESGEVCWRDVGQIANTNYYFVLRASIGHEAQTLQAMNHDAKQRWGTIAYAIPAFMELIKTKPVTFTIQIDDNDPFDIQGITAFVAASNRFSPRINFVLSHEIEPDDGLLHVGVVHPEKLIQNIPVMLNTAALEARDLISLYPIKRYVRIDATPTQPMQVDGELMSEKSPLEVYNHPNAVPFITPIRYSRAFTGNTAS